MTLAEMYIQGVSTRKVTAILEQLCGTSVSATQVSKAMALLDETLQARRQRPLCECPYLSCMPATKRCARMVRYGMLLY